MSDRKYLVFLDIDGVFASHRVHIAQNNAEYGIWNKFDPVAIEFMNKIHDEYAVQFVLMSTWKNYLKHDDPNIEHWMTSAFMNSGFRGNFATPWKTDPKESWTNKAGYYTRAHEVKEYLEEYGKDIKDFIMFDDNDYGFETVLGKKRLIRTDPDNGLLFKHMLKAKSLIGMWEPKK